MRVRRAGFGAEDLQHAFLSFAFTMGYVIEQGRRPRRFDRPLLRSGLMYRILATKQ